MATAFQRSAAGRSADPTGKLPGTDDISVKWMMKDGNILVAEATGPQSLVNEAQKQMEQYIIDLTHYYRDPLSIRITDRRQNPDSLKWVTKNLLPGCIKEACCVNGKRITRALSLLRASTKPLGCDGIRAAAGGEPGQLAARPGRTDVSQFPFPEC